MAKNSLEALRRKKGFSQQGIANRAGIAVSTYHQYETGVRNVPVEIAQKISEILEVEVTQIFLPNKFTVSKMKE